MISVECREYNADGIADLSEAIFVAKEQGIANAIGALHPDIVWGNFSLVMLASLGQIHMVPGLQDGAMKNGVSNYVMNVAATLPPIRKTIRSVEAEVRRVAGDELPNWRPSRRVPGVRLVTMKNDADFRMHGDCYEGLVVSAQIAQDGKKIMHTKFGDTPVRAGDITLFGCDSFSFNPRTEHGFSFSGVQALALVIGQDPFYTISGRYPFLEEHPEYFPPDILQKYLGKSK